MEPTRNPALHRETPKSPPPPPSSGTGPRTYSPPTAPPELHCACAARAPRGEARGRGASGCCAANSQRSTETGHKDFRSAGHSGLEGGGALVWAERLRNRLLLAESAVKGSDGRLGSGGGVRKSCPDARTHAVPKTPPSAWASLASKVEDSAVVAFNFLGPWNLS